MTIDLAGRRALVTGSTSGLGLAMATALAGAGADVMLNGLGEAKAIEVTRAGIEKKTGRRVLYDGADMTRPDEIAAMVKRAEGEFGGIDILVNNAGIQFTAKVEDFPPERWDAILAINLTAVFHGCRAALPGMKARGWGRIVNTASAHGLVASVEKSAYVAAKHGVVGLTKVVALEAAEDGITCNCICPGWVRTAIVEKQIVARAEAKGVPVEEEAKLLVGEKCPTKTFVTPDQIAAYCLFLCSDAAAQITGAAMTMDGGWTAQ
ncbi:MAG: 3-hydroxybutyrate dehydrogenase [Rhodospirillaceae bacterium]|jgi:3-hydroxybutyrate dehydrogenase|nr:3-hydroxybutyrate dehydrogenase [Rhodospirillaceae bacterium]